jgi:hypothetical protein
VQHDRFSALRYSGGKSKRAPLPFAGSTLAKSAASGFDKRQFLTAKKPGEFRGAVVEKAGPAGPAICGSRFRPEIIPIVRHFTARSAMCAKRTCEPFLLLREASMLPSVNRVAGKGARQETWQGFWLSIARIAVLEVVLLVGLSSVFITYLNWSSEVTFAEFLSAGVASASNPAARPARAHTTCECGA